MIIGIAGTLGAGKGTVVECLKSKGFVHYSASGALREILHAEGLVANRDNFTVLADKLRLINPASPHDILFNKYEDDAPENAILESIHSEGEALFLRGKGAIILGVDADIEIRYERVSTRGTDKDSVTFEEFKKMAIHEEEGGGQHNIRAVLKMADHIIMNDGTIEDLYTKVEAWLENLK